MFFSVALAAVLVPHNDGARASFNGPGVLYEISGYADPSPHLQIVTVGVGRQTDAVYEAARGATHNLRTPDADDRRELPVIDPDEVIQSVCVRCHNDRRLVGNLSLEGFQISSAGDAAEIAEKMVRKLRAGMMPPPPSRPPAGDTLLELVMALEDVLDRSSAENPNPGTRVFQRMNRAEYQAAILDIFGLEVDAGHWLPLDQKSANFDNIADAQTLSPTLLEAYLNAASEISRLAVGDVTSPPLNKTYTTSIYTSQHPWDHVEGAPFGTRGGLVVNHIFPADAEYTFEMTFGDGGDTRLEDMDI